MKHSAPALPKRRAAQLALVLVPVLAVFLGTSVIWQTSYAAYSATTSNPTDSWATGTVALVDDDANGAMFTVTGMKPGSTGTRCITVTSNGSLPAAIKLYGTGLSTTNAVSTYLTLVVTKGTGGSFGSCTGFSPDASTPTVYNGLLSGLSTKTDYASGLATWTTAGAGESRTFQFAYTFDVNAPTSTQNGTAGVTFTWESQNT